jgi:transcriptional regulator with XRE-family HTH domain
MQDQIFMDERDSLTMEDVSDSEHRPHVGIGRYLRAIREQKYKTQTEFAENADPPIDNSQISNVERGLNVRVSTYARYARALGYRNLIELFRAPADPELRRLLQLWRRLDEYPQERKELLQIIRDYLDARGA